MSSQSHNMTATGCASQTYTPPVSQQNTQRIQVQVKKIEIVAERVKSIELTPAQLESIPDFDAGAHIDVFLPNGLTRQYSLWRLPNEDSASFHIAVLCEENGRGGSQYIHEQLKVDDVIEVSQPRNLFPLVDAQNYLLVAGGIGITPILSMATQLQQANKPFSFHYCARNSKSAAFINHIQASSWCENTALYFDEDSDKTPFDPEALLKQQGSNTHLFICGPSGFIDWVTSIAEKIGMPAEQIHFERFGVATSVPQSVDKEGEAKVDFEVEIASTGQVIPVLSNQTVLQALNANGVEVPVSCEQGICGTCMMRVIDGQPDHQDMFLSNAEQAANDRFTTCCSRSLSPRLTIDFI